MPYWKIPLATAAQAQAEAGDIVVEVDRVALAGRQGEVVDCGLGKIHVGSENWEGYGKVARASSSALMQSMKAEI
jgi:hypothetical protein